MRKEAWLGFQAWRVYSDEDGISNLEDLVLEFPRSENSIYSDTKSFTPTAVFLRSFVSREVWPQHTVPSKQFVVVLQGSVRMETGDGQRKVFQPGDVVFVEDVDGFGHTNHPTSDLVTLHLYVPDSFETRSI